MELPAMAILLLLALGMLWALQGLSKTFTQFLRSRRGGHPLAHKHFIQGAQLLARSRAPGGGSSAAKGRSFAHQAVAQAELAISLNPSDAASHILKALALEQLGNTSAALRSLSLALSPPVCLALSPVEKADALIRKASLQLATLKGRKGALAALEDLEEAKGYSIDNPKLQSLIDSCHKRLGMDKRAAGSE